MMLSKVQPFLNSSGGHMKKMNCWEFKKCGRELGGARKDLGVCSAAIERRLDGTHGGSNAGRACWVVAGTMCGGQEQGTFATKYHNCEKCDFYRLVRYGRGAALYSFDRVAQKIDAIETPLFLKKKLPCLLWSPDPVWGTNGISQRYGWRGHPRCLRNNLNFSCNSASF